MKTNESDRASRFMSGRLIWVVVLPAAILLSNCGSSESDDASPGPTTATTKYTPPPDTPLLTTYTPEPRPTASETAEPADDAKPVTSRAAFVAAVAIYAPVFATLSNDQLTTLGYNICVDLDTSQDFIDTSFVAADAGSQLLGTAVDPVDAAGLVGAAIGSLCDRHSGLLP